MAKQRKAVPERSLEELAAFLQEGMDERRVTDLETPLEVRLTGSTLYIPAYTRVQMDKAVGKPLMAIWTKTDTEAFKVYFGPASPDAKEARRLRMSRTMSGALVRFGVPLRKLQLKLPAGRRYLLPVEVLPVPRFGTVFAISFNELEHEPRSEDQEVKAAVRKAEQEKTRARKEKRIRRITGAQGG